LFDGVFFEQRPAFFGLPFIDYIHIDDEPTGAAEAQSTTCADCTESSGSLLPGQLVQAMASFGGGSGAADGLNTSLVGADTSQQTFLTAPQHA